MDNLIRLYESTEKAFTSGGLGCLSDATKCIVAEERNGEYELELEYPINGIHYSDIAIRRIILCRPNPYDDPQPFRIYSISKPISGIVTVNAAHVCYDLSNYVCLPFIATTSAEVFQRLNGYASGSETSRIYPPGIIYNASTNPYGFRFTTDMNVSFPPKAQSQKPEPEDERFKVLIPKSIKAVLGDASDCILGRFINSQGHRGEYYYDRFHVYLKDPDGSSPRGATRGFEIRYGKNMTDVEKEETSKDDYTHILPFWKSVQSQDTTIAILGGDGQTAPVVAVPGSTGRTDIKIKIVDLSSEFDKSPTATKLTQYAQDYISENELTGQPSVNITVNFQSVANSSEYSAYSKLEEVRLCDKVKVIYEALGIVDEKKVIRYEYNVLKCAYDEIEIGDPKDELANTISGTSQVTMNTQSVGETVKNGLVETITNAIKLSQTIYYVDTTGTYTEANPPAPPEDWVIDTLQTKGKPNVWTATEPESTDKGNVFTYSQNRLTDDTVNLSDFSLANIATTVRNIVDPNDPTKVHGDNLTDDSVDTPKITDEAITSNKLAADAVQSRTYTAGSDPYYSSEGTLINLAGEGFIRAKNFSIDPNGNVHLRGTVTAAAGYLGTEQNGFAIEPNALTGTYVKDGYAYAVTLATDGSLIMRPVPFDVGESYRSSVLSDGILRLSAYNDNIGTAGRIDVDSANMGMTFYKYSATSAENLENYAINGQNGTAIGSIEVLNTNNTSIMSTTGTWQLSGDTYISGHTNQTIKEWIESIEAGGIAPATTSTLGGVIIGSGLSVAANGLLTVNTNTIATRSWANSTFAKPSDIKTYTGTEPITVSSANVIGINYSTGLTLGDGSALEVDLTTNSPIASKTWVGQQGYLTSIPTASSTTKGGVKVDATGGLSVTNEVLKVNLGTGLEFGNSTNVIQVIDYANLAKKSEIPTVNNATLTIQRNGTTVKTFTANASSNVTANITVPTKTSDLTNDSGFITGVTWTGVSSKPFNTIDEQKGLEVTSNALGIKYGTGLTIDSESGELTIDSTVALKSDIPTVNNATLTIQRNGTTVKTFTANASSNVTANITVPTTAADIGAAESDHDHALSIASSTGTSAVDLAANSKYLLTAGGKTLIFKTPPVPTVNNATLTIQKNGTTVKTFTANASSNVTANITVPVNVSELTNDSGYLTSVSWNDVGSKPFNTVGAGLEVDTNKILKVKAGNGIKIDSDADNGVAVDLSASDIPALTSAKISDFDSAVDTALGIGSGSTFLRKDGTWATPTNTTYTGEKGITVSSAHKIGHSNTAIDAVTTQGMYKISFDAYGHIDAYTAIAKADITNLGIPSTNTTYTFANGTNGFTVTPSGGTAQTVTVTPSIANNVTGTGTSGYLAKFNGAHTLTNGPQLGSNTTTFLNNKGEWSTPVGTTYTGEKGISVSAANKIGHSNTAIDAVTTQGMYKISFDAYGHIDGYTATAKADITGLLGASSSGSTGKFLNQQGGWTTPTNTTYGFSGSLSNHAFTSTLTAGGSGTTSVLTLAAGSNITLTDDTTNKKITIAATVPTVNNATLTIQKNGTNVATFTANASSNATANITVPTTASDIGAAESDHDHPLSLAESTGTSSITLKASTKYLLTAGGKTYIFTTPPNTTYSAGTGIAISSANAISNSGVRAVTINSNYLRVNTNGTNADLTIPYATTAGSIAAVPTTSLDTQEKIDAFLTANRFQYGLFKTTSENNVGMASNDGMILSLPWSTTSYGAQIALDDATAGVMKFRGKSSTWGDWRTVIHDGNYTTYTVTKNGTGATGTWGISITGSAGSASSASHLTALTNSDTASSSTTWRKVWMTYADGVTGRPAVSDALTFQTSSGTLKATNFSGAFTGNLTGNVTGSSSGNAYWANVATASSSNSNTDPTFRYGTMSEVRLRESASSTTVKATIVYNATTAAIDFNFA